MERTDLILRTETYTKEAMSQKDSILTIAHDFKHVDRVRNWALLIADAENFPNVEMVEVTALLHDIGLGQLNNGTERTEHGSLGAGIARTFLRNNSNLSMEQIELIADAINYHGLHPLVAKEHLQALGEKGKLLEIIRDADLIDALGAVGLMRVFTSKYHLPDYNPLNIKGDTWGLTPAELTTKQVGDSKGKTLTSINTIIDQVNRQIRNYHNLHTKTARNLANPLVQFMVNFILQLEREISQAQTTRMVGS